MCLLLLLAPLLSGVVAVGAALFGFAAVATVALVNGIVGLFCLLLAPFGFKRRPRPLKAWSPNSSLTGRANVAELPTFTERPWGPRPASVMRGEAS